jgi:hypothetical protein
MMGIMDLDIPTSREFLLLHCPHGTKTLPPAVCRYSRMPVRIDHTTIPSAFSLTGRLASLHTYGPMCAASGPHIDHGHPIAHASLAERSMMVFSSVGVVRTSADIHLAALTGCWASLLLVIAL